MKTLARFVCRPTKDGRGDVILGVMFKDQNPDVLAPNRIYEIREIMGVATLVDVGEAAITDNPNTSLLPGCTWFSPFGDIPELSAGRFILTRDEVLAERARR
jgi:hypothetical protein